MAEDFVSLYTLMNNHLSNLSICDTSHSGNSQNPPAIGTPGSTGPDPLAPFPVQNTFNIPQFFPENNAIKELLSEQIANMLKAKDKQRQEEEEKKLAEEMRKLELKEEQEYLIDLTEAIIRKPVIEAEVTTEVVEEKKKKKVVPWFRINKPLRFSLRVNKELYDFSTWKQHLPCCTDLSFIMKKKVRRARPSRLGKVLCARRRPVYVPYIIEKPQTTIVPFDFSTKSPCDLYLENKWKPTMHNPYTPNILDWI